MEGNKQKRKAVFVTDLGEEPVVYKGTSFNNKDVEIILKRYGVWGDKGKGKPEVMESSDNLQYLLDKYNLPETEVYTMDELRENK